MAIVETEKQRSKLTLHYTKKKRKVKEILLTRLRVDSRVYSSVGHCRTGTSCWEPNRWMFLFKKKTGKAMRKKEKKKSLVKMLVGNK